MDVYNPHFPQHVKRVNINYTFKSLCLANNNYSSFQFTAASLHIQQPGILAEQSVPVCIIDHTDQSYFIYNLVAILNGKSIEDLLKQPLCLLTAYTLTAPDYAPEKVTIGDMRKDEQALFIDSIGLSHIQPLYIKPDNLGNANGYYQTSRIFKSLKILLNKRLFI